MFRVRLSKWFGFCGCFIKYSASTKGFPFSFYQSIILLFHIFSGPAHFVVRFMGPELDIEWKRISFLIGFISSKTCLKNIRLTIERRTAP
jgi:hypothetical protein